MTCTWTWLVARHIFAGPMRHSLFQIPVGEELRVSNSLGPSFHGGINDVSLPIHTLGRVSRWTHWNHQLGFIQILAITKPLPLCNWQEKKHNVTNATNNAMTLVVVSCPRKRIFERLNLGDLTFQKPPQYYFYIFLRNFQTSIVTTSICSELERWDQSRATFSIPTIFLLFFMSRAKASCSAYPKCIALGLTSGTCCPSGGAWVGRWTGILFPRYSSNSSFWMAELTKMKYDFCRHPTPNFQGSMWILGSFVSIRMGHEREGTLKLLWSHLVHWFHRWFRGEG